MINVLVAIINFVKPASEIIWVVTMLYIIVTIIRKPKKKGFIVLRRFCYGYYLASVGWYILLKFIFVPGNMWRFQESFWLPVIEALFY